MKTKISFSRAAGINNYCIDVNREGYVGTVYKDQTACIWHACSLRLESYSASTRKAAADGLLRIIRKRELVVNREKGK